MTPDSRQKATEPDEVRDLYRISPKQEAALEAILRGSTDAEAAETAGVSRQTVNDWKNHHPAFQVELAWRQREAAAAVAARLRRLRLSAIDVIENAVATGDVSVALTVLTKVSIPVEQPNTSHTDARELVRAQVPGPLSQLLAHRNPQPSVADIAQRERAIRQTLADGYG